MTSNMLAVSNGYFKTVEISFLFEIQILQAELQRINKKRVTLNVEKRNLLLLQKYYYVFEK